MFQVKDVVVYGVVGVCEIADIATPPIKGIDGEYYFLQPVYDNKGIIYSPVSNNKVQMRKIITKETAEKLYAQAKHCRKDPALNEKVAPGEYDAYVKSQEPLKLLHLVRALYNIKNERAKDLRKMKSQDSRMLHAARKLLYGEMAAALEIDMEKLSDEMDQFLEQG